MAQKSNIASLNKKNDFTKTKMIKAFIIDYLIWAYSILTIYFVIYNKMLNNFYRNGGPDVSFGKKIIWAIAILGVTSVFFCLKTSIGKWYFKLLDESKIHLAKKLLYFILCIIFVAGLHFTQFSLYEFLSEDGMAGAVRIFSALLSPNFGIIIPALDAAIETIYMAFIATAFAIPIAFILGFFAARNLMDETFLLRSIYSVTRFFLNLSRSIEPLVWAIIFSVWVGIGPFSGMLALWLHSVASLSKLYSEQIENINEGPIEAMKSTGAHPIQVIWFGVVPQIILPYLSFTIYRWDINIRMATVIGLVGGGGIGTMLMQYQGLAKWNEVGLLVMVIASIVWLMDYASANIRAKFK